MATYDPLQEFFSGITGSTNGCSLSFADIEKKLGDSLPASARKYRAWWANEWTPGNHVQARGWLNAGWMVDDLDIARESVQFRRI